MKFSEKIMVDMPGDPWLSPLVTQHHAPMKTYLTITYVRNRHEETHVVIRPRHLKKPTHRGAERMVARALDVKPSEIAVSRIQEAIYAR